MTQRDCEHGQLARSCLICELQAELQAEVDRLNVALVDERGRHQEFERELVVRASIVDGGLRAEIAAQEKLLLDFAVPYTEKDEKGGVVDSKKWAQTCNAMHAIRVWYLKRKAARKP
jgi:hypothetical protein